MKGRYLGNALWTSPFVSLIVGEWKDEAVDVADVVAAVANQHILTILSIPTSAARNILHLNTNNRETVQPRLHQRQHKTPICQEYTE